MSPQPPPGPHHTLEVLASGAVLHRWHPNAAPKATIVVQHGFGEYAERYLTLHHALIDHLLDAELEVWALDMWGHGRSPGRRGVCHVGRAIADHRHVLAKAATTGRQVFAFGHSLGGLVTAASVACYDSSIADNSLADASLAGVLLLSPALPNPRPRPARRAIGALARVLPGVSIPGRRRPLDELTHRGEVVAATAADSRMYNGQVGFLLAATALAAMDGVRARAADSATGWPAPTLLIHGTADTYADPTGSEDLAAAIGTQAELVLVPAGYHELLHDTDADRTLTRVLDFIRRGQERDADQSAKG